MLRPRDREILKKLDLFRCMTRDQIASIFFSHVKNPITATNYVLKRLRRENLIEANTDVQPYVYFSSPLPIKKNSQKVRHYLAVVDFYIDLCKYESPTVFEVEKRYGSGYMQPDIFMIWRGKPFFVEIQLSRYSTSLMKQKLERYHKYFISNNWICREKLDKNPSFPTIWIISPLSYNVQSEYINIIETKNVYMLYKKEFNKS